MIKVLIVDSSSYIRVKIRETLEKESNIKVVGIARDHSDALEKTLNLKPHVIVMDMDIPEISGIQAANNIINKQPTPIILMIGPEHNYDNSQFIDNCIIDFIPKDDISKTNLIQKVYWASEASCVCPKDRTYKSSPKKMSREPFHVVAIGISTGGPRALSFFLPQIDPNIDASILIAQHMPSLFTHSLAKRLNDICQIEVKEAQDGESLRRGYAYICPGGFHMAVGENGIISLYEKKELPQYNFIPSANLLIESVSRIYGPKALCIIMTGMGTDGLKGASIAKKAGSYIIAQSHRSSTIYGMPKAIIDKGLQDEILDLGEIGQRINALCN